MNELEAIKERLSAAVPGPWSLSLDYQRKWMLLLAESGTADEYRIAKLADDDTAEFIAHSRTDIPKLIAALETVLALTKRWHEEHASSPSEASDIRDWVACDIEEEIAGALA